MAVLVPEIPNKSGLIVTKNANARPDHWYAIFDYEADSDSTNTKFQRTVKLGVYYLRSFDIYDIDVNIERISKQFDGIGINIYVSKGPNDKGQTKISFKPTGTMKAT